MFTDSALSVSSKNWASRLDGRAVTFKKPLNDCSGFKFCFKPQLTSALKTSENISLHFTGVIGNLQLTHAEACKSREDGSHFSTPSAKKSAQFLLIIGKGKTGNIGRRRCEGRSWLKKKKKRKSLRGKGVCYKNIMIR